MVDRGPHHWPTRTRLTDSAAHVADRRTSRGQVVSLHLAKRAGAAAGKEGTRASRTSWPRGGGFEKPPRSPAGGLIARAHPRSAATIRWRPKQRIRLAGPAAFPVCPVIGGAGDSMDDFGAPFCRSGDDLARVPHIDC